MPKKTKQPFVPATRREVFARIKDLNISKCPFVNLPKMKQCIWVKPKVVVRIDFLEWTGADHLRHTQFAARRDDKDPRKVIKESTVSA